MKRKRTYRTKELKFKIAIEALKGNRQISEIAEEYKVHPNQVTQWKKELLEKGADIFSRDEKDEEKKLKSERDFLFQKVGEQAIRIDWLKKNLRIED
jgi:transposase-like protein